MRRAVAERASAEASDAGADVRAAGTAGAARGVAARVLSPTGVFAHNARIAALVAPCELVLLAAGGGTLVGLAVFGVLLTYALDLSRLREGALAALWGTLLSLALGHMINALAEFGFSALGLMLGWQVGAFCALVGAWGSMSFRSLVDAFPAEALLAERALFAVLPFLSAPIVAWGALAADAPSRAPLYLGAWLSLSFTLCGLPVRASLARVRSAADAPTACPRQTAALQLAFALLGPAGFDALLHGRLRALVADVGGGAMGGGGGGALDVLATVALPAALLSALRPEHAFWWLLDQSALRAIGAGGASAPDSAARAEGRASAAPGARAPRAASAALRVLAIVVGATYVWRRVLLGSLHHYVAVPAPVDVVGTGVALGAATLPSLLEAVGAPSVRVRAPMHALGAALGAWCVGMPAILAPVPAVVAFSANYALAASERPSPPLLAAAVAGVDLTALTFARRVLWPVHFQFELGAARGARVSLHAVVLGVLLGVHAAASALAWHVHARAHARTHARPAPPSHAPALLGAVLPPLYLCEYVLHTAHPAGLMYPDYLVLATSLAGAGALAVERARAAGVAARGGGAAAAAAAARGALGGSAAARGSSGGGADAAGAHGGGGLTAAVACGYLAKLALLLPGVASSASAASAPALWLLLLCWAYPLCAFERGEAAPAHVALGALATTVAAVLGRESALAPLAELLCGARPTGATTLALVLALPATSAAAALTRHAPRAAHARRLTVLALGMSACVWAVQPCLDLPLLLHSVEHTLLHPGRPFTRGEAPRLLLWPPWALLTALCAAGAGALWAPKRGLHPSTAALAGGGLGALGGLWACGALGVPPSRIAYALLSCTCAAHGAVLSLARAPLAGARALQLAHLSALALVAVACCAVGHLVPVSARQLRADGAERVRVAALALGAGLNTTLALLVKMQPDVAPPRTRPGGSVALGRTAHALVAPPAAPTGNLACVVGFALGVAVHTRAAGGGVWSVAALAPVLLLLRASPGLGAWLAPHRTYFAPCAAVSFACAFHSLGALGRTLRAASLSHAPLRTSAWPVALHLTMAALTAPSHAAFLRYVWTARPQPQLRTACLAPLCVLPLVLSDTPAELLAGAAGVGYAVAQLLATRWRWMEGLRRL